MPKERLIFNPPTDRLVIYYRGPRAFTYDYRNNNHFNYSQYCMRPHA